MLHALQDGQETSKRDQPTRREWSGKVPSTLMHGTRYGVPGTLTEWRHICFLKLGVPVNDEKNHQKSYIPVF